MATLEIEAGDIVRLVLQFLKENGLNRSFETLQEESQLSINTVDSTEQLTQDILSGNWDVVLQSVSALKLPESVVCDLHEQMVIEMVELREIDTARAVLRQTDALGSLRQNQPDRYLRLERLLQKSFFDPLEAYQPGQNKEIRRQAIADALVNQVAVVPPSRLITLISQALKWQRHVGALPDGIQLDLFRGAAQKAIIEAEIPVRQQRVAKKIEPMCCLFSPAGDFYATGSKDGFIELWDSTSGKLKKDLDYQARDELMMHDESVLCLSLTRDGELLASGAADGKIKVWRVRSGQCLRRLNKAHEKGVTCLAFGRDGSQLLSCSMDMTARVHGMKSGKTLKELRGHSSYVSYCSYGESNANIYTASSDGTVKVWDSHTAHCVCTFRPPQPSIAQDVSVHTVLPLPGTDQIIVCASTLQVHIMTAQGQVVRSLAADFSLDTAGKKKEKNIKDEEEKCTFTSCFPTPKASYIYAGTDDGRLVCFDMKSGDMANVIQVHGKGNAILGVSVHPHRNFVATVSDEGNLIVWQP